jgi:tRNA(His) guanylyltransferase
MSIGIDAWDHPKIISGLTITLFSFVFHKSCALFERRSRCDSLPSLHQTSNGSSKLVTTIVSTFTAYYVHLWASFFSESPLSAPLPSFDGRAVQYPSVQNLRDYMSWRQVDCEFSLVVSVSLWLILKVTSITCTIRPSGLWFRLED